MNETKIKKKQVGIDIGTNSIKIVEVEIINEGKGRLVNYAIGDLYKKENVNVKNLPSKDLADSIINLMDEAKINTADVGFSIGVEESFTVFVKTPLIQKDKLDQALAFEVKKYLPMDISEVKLGYKIVNRNTVNQSMSILASAVPKRIIEKYKNIALLGELNLITLEIETFSVVRALGLLGETSFIINIGALKSSLCIVKQGYPLLNSTIDLGGVHFTKAIANALEIDFLRAEQMKINEGVTGQVEVALQAIINRFATEADNLVKKFEAQQNEKVKNVVLLGKTSQMKGLKNYFTRILNSFRILNVSVLNSLEIPTNLDQKNVENLTADMAIAIGVALQLD